MKTARKKRCRSCGETLKPDPRAAKVQKYCSQQPCQQARQRRKYRRWLDQPAHAAAHGAALKSWAGDYPNYWRRYRQTHPEYARRDNERRAKAMWATRCSAKQTDWREIAVERLDAIAAPGAEGCSAKQTDCARRVASLVEFMRWTVDGSCSAKRTGMAWMGGTAG